MIAALLGIAGNGVGADVFAARRSSIEPGCAQILTQAQIIRLHLDANSQDLTRLFSYYEEQARNWRAFLNGTAPDGSRVHVLHQTGLKDLNESIWHMAGTEDYLEVFHDLLHQYLKTNPSFGSVLHNDYKNHFISSPLDAPTFRALVVEPVTRRLALHMENRKPGWNWRAWILSTLHHGEGATPVEAYFRAGLARARYSRHVPDVSAEQWRAGAVARRERLRKTTQAKHIEWDAFLATLHAYVGRGAEEEAALKDWLTEKGAPELLGEMRAYYDDLQIADFHPLSEPNGIPTSIEELIEHKQRDPMTAHRSNWTVERRALFAMAEQSRYIAVTDVQNLGSIARRFQDHWIGNGARLDELQNVYAKSTQALESFFAKTHRQLREILGAAAQIHVYRSGDDGIWFLPKMGSRQKTLVRKLFRELRDTGEEHETLSLKLHYSNLMTISGDKAGSDGVAEALTRARASLFAGKARHKAK